MVFSKHLLEGIRRGRIRCSVRIWTRPHVKAGGRYVVGDGHIVVDSIQPIAMSQVTESLARESGFDTVEALLKKAQHGSGTTVYLVRFHYLRAGAWNEKAALAGAAPPAPGLLERIRRSAPPASPRKKRAAPPRGRPQS